MTIKSSVGGILPPLFDRICSNSREEKVLDLEGLKLSIITELTLILNTRCVVRKAIYEERSETLAFFGLPDFSEFEDLGEFREDKTSNWPELARRIGVIIEGAEPRLEAVHVKIEGFDAFSQSLSILVLASVKKVVGLKNIRFPLTLDYKNLTSSSYA